MRSQGTGRVAGKIASSNTDGSLASTHYTRIGTCCIARQGDPCSQNLSIIKEDRVHVS